MSALLKLLPCWGLLERMGHQRTWAHFELLEGLTVVATVPAVEAGVMDGWERAALDEERLVLQLGGPAFYGFHVLTEQQVRQARLDSRPVRYSQTQIQTQRRQLPGPTSPPSFPPAGWVWQEEERVWTSPQLGAEVQIRFDVEVDGESADQPDTPWLRIVSPQLGSAELAARLAEPLICALDLILNRWSDEGIARPDVEGVWRAAVDEGEDVDDPDSEDAPPF